MSKKVTRDQVAECIINLNASMNLCDSDTAKGLKSSKKKDILKSGKDDCFARFEQEILKRQEKKDQRRY